MNFSRIVFVLVLVSACGPVPDVAEPKRVAVQIEPSIAAAAETTSPTVLSRVDPDFSGFPSGHIPVRRAKYLLHIDQAGLVVSVRPDPPGHPKVDAVLVETLSKWRFNPATRKGVPVPIDYTFTVKFNLD